MCHFPAIDAVTATGTVLSFEDLVNEAGCSLAGHGLIFDRRQRIGKGMTASLYKIGISITSRTGPLNVDPRGRAHLRPSRALV